MMTASISKSPGLHKFDPAHQGSRPEVRPDLNLEVRNDRHAQGRAEDPITIRPKAYIPLPRPLTPSTGRDTTARYP